MPVRGPGAARPGPRGGVQRGLFEVSRFADAWRRRVELQHQTCPPKRTSSSASTGDAEAEPAGAGDPEEAGTSATKTSNGRAMPPVLRVLLIGTRDAGSPLSRLAGHEPLVIEIYEKVARWSASRICRDGVYAAKIANVSFPAPRGACCNMMPIVMPNSIRLSGGRWTESIPRRFQQYIPLIRACPISEDDTGQIGYLTVHESLIEEDGDSQRRPGLHVEAPARLSVSAGGGGGELAPPRSDGTFYWGGGHLVGSEMQPLLAMRGIFSGGIYMASTVSRSCRVWNAKVTDPDCIGWLGDIEHMRHTLERGVEVGAGELIWITDRTPHESLPLPAGTYRQYFRLVTSKVSAWYSRHSTENELGIRPPPWVRIIDGDKFVGEGEGEGTGRSAGGAVDALRDLSLSTSGGG